MVNKIPDYYENPIDVQLLKTCSFTSTLLYKLNMTPNQITTLSLIAGLISIYYYKTQNYIKCGIFFFLSYYFDCLDGFYARKYKMVTKFGDIYDHIKDWLIIILFAYLIYYNDNVNNKFKNISLIILVLMLVMVFIHFRYQEIYYHNITTKDSEYSIMKNLFENLLSNRNYDNMRYTRFFGTGTWNIIFILFLMMHKYYTK